jgi:hypothetical protein
MADLMFKRGPSNRLPAATKAQDGTFYLTTDSERLYVGIGTNLVELNKSIRSVANYDALPQSGSSVEVGDFYYLTKENILAICTATSPSVNWIQINKDTYLDEKNSGVEVELSNKTATVTTTIKDSADNTATGNFSITAAGNLTMSVSGTTITLDVPDGAKYDLSAKATTESNAAAIALTNQSDSSDEDTVVIKGGDYVTVTRKDNTITIAGEDHYNESAEGVALSDTNVGKNNGETSGFEIRVTDANDTVNAVIDPTITYGNDGAGNSTQTAKFKSGTLNIDTYTKSEADDAISAAVEKATQTFDAMEYKGTVGSATELNSKTDQKNGYTYKASADFTVDATKTTSGEKTNVKTGDLLIAQGTESNGVITAATLKWDIVPSGDEQTITFGKTGVDNAIVISDGADTVGYKVVGSTTDKTEVTYTTSDGITTAAVKHSKITAPTTTGSTSDVEQSDGDSATFTAITGITEDGYGHVTGVTTHSFKVVDTHADLGNIDSAAEVISATSDETKIVNIGLTLNNADGDSEGDIKVTSSTLNLTTSNVAANTTSKTAGVGTLNIDLEWGEF